jgi:hypothetical protein
MSDGSSSTPLVPPEVLPPTVVEVVEWFHWSVIPCSLGKKPIVRTWKERQEVAATIEELRAQALLQPASWAVVTGKLSNVVAFDFDGEAGAKTMRDLGLDPHVQTGSGSFHTYIEHPGDFRVPTLNTKAAPSLQQVLPGCDIKGDGGYAIIAGRNRKGPYRVLRSLKPDPCTPELRELLMQVASLGHARHNKRQGGGQPHGGEKPPSNSTNALRGPTASADVLLRYALRRSIYGRNSAGFDLACQLRDNGFKQDQATEVMAAYVARVGPTDQKGYAEPYTDAEATASLHQAFSRTPRAPWGLAYPTRIAAGLHPEEKPQDADKAAASKEESQEDPQTEADGDSPPPQSPFGPQLVSPDEPQRDGRPWIVTNNRPLHRISADALAALQLSNQRDPYLFVRGARIVEVIADEQGHRFLRSVDETAMRGFLSRSASFSKQSTKLIHIFPPLPVARDILKRTPTELDLPPLIGLVEAPQVDEMGRVLLKPGYDSPMQLYYAPSSDLRDLSVPVNPTESEVRWAKKQILDELLYDFPFADEASKANAVAELVTSLVRSAFRGPVPALGIDAVTPNSGKTYLAGTFSRVATGRVDVLTTAPSSNESGEFRKKITSFCLRALTSSSSTM